MATFFQALGNKTTQLDPKRVSVLIDISHHFTVKVLFCSLIKGINYHENSKLCCVLTTSGLSCAWILFTK